MSYEKISNYFYDKLEQLKAKAHLKRVTDFEIQFLDDRWLAMEDYGDRMRLSEKQKDVLRDICLKNDV